LYGTANVTTYDDLYSTLEHIPEEAESVPSIESHIGGGYSNDFICIVFFSCIFVIVDVYRKSTTITILNVYKY